MRQLTGSVGIGVTTWLVAAALFHLWLGTIGVLELRLMRSLHLMFLLPAVFILFPARPGHSPMTRPSASDMLMAAAAIAVTLYVAVNHEQLRQRLELVSGVSDVQVAFGVIAVLLMLEATRRVVGMGMTVVFVLSVAYLLLGSELPSPFGHRPLPFARVVERLYLVENQGIFGSLTGISVSYLFLFVLFGVFVQLSGIGDWFSTISRSLVGHRVGGPAKIAVINSAIFGSITGSPTANVYGTGVYTIPLMKTMGYRDDFAGGVEAAASTGGQITPPVMGAAVFIMMSLLGMTYLDIITSAVPPAILFFLAVGAVVHFEAKRSGVLTIPRAELPRLAPAALRSFYLAPIVVMLVVLFLGYSPAKAAVAGILAAIVVSFARLDTRMTPGKLRDALEAGTKAALLIAVACASAGVIVSAMTATGISLAFSTMVVTLTKGLLAPSLILVGLTALLLGMGMPTTPAYILAATVGAPALTELGVNPFAAHMFVFYFAIFSGVTPPVAITAYAAAGVAGASPMRTSVQAFKLSIAGFIVPFAFVYHPTLLLQGSYQSFFLFFAAGCLGVVAVAAAMAGYFVRPLPAIVRVTAAVAGMLIILPDWQLTAAGLMLLLPCIAQQVFAMRHERAATPVCTSTAGKSIEPIKKA